MRNNIKHFKTKKVSKREWEVITMCMEVEVWDI